MVSLLGNEIVFSFLLRETLFVHTLNIYMLAVRIRLVCVFHVDFDWN